MKQVNVKGSNVFSKFNVYFSSIWISLATVFINSPRESVGISNKVGHKNRCFIKLKYEF